MSLAKQRSIEKLIRNSTNEIGNDASFKLSEESKAHINSCHGQANINAEIVAFETELFGKKIAPWIQPLHFERNLNSANDALESVEAILSEYRNLKLMDIQRNYASAMLASIQDSDALDRHHDLYSKIDHKAYRENIELRLVKKVIELVEFTKASKLGAKILFGIPLENIEYQGALRGVSRIRESLRKLVEQYRMFANAESESIVPVSMKFGSRSATDFLVSEWQPDNPLERKPFQQLAFDQLKFDLSNYDPISTLELQRIRRIGVQVVDRKSGISEPPSEDPSDIHRDLWRMTLSDQSRGIKIGDSVNASRQRFDPIEFHDVAGSRDSKSITWSRTDSILNINANRKWALNIHQTSHMGSPLGYIHDIILHFHLAYKVE